MVFKSNQRADWFLSPVWFGSIRLFRRTVQPYAESENNGDLTSNWVVEPGDGVKRRKAAGLVLDEAIAGDAVMDMVMQGGEQSPT